jgi:tripartite-type tricarboxylate transporter receptor subunit TctC
LWQKAFGTMHKESLNNRESVMRRYASIFAFVCAIFTTLWLPIATEADAQEFPTRPIRLIVPYPAGDLADTIARLLGNDMSKSLGQPIVVDNRPGASGLIGLQAVVQSDADGYTIVLAQMGSLAVASHVNPWPFKVLDAFEPIGMAYTNYMMLVTTPNLPVKTLAELIAYSKKNPEGVRIATNGVGGFPHLAVEQLRKQAGLNFSHIPYRGSSAILSDLMAGRVDATIFGYTGLYPFVQDGRLNGIAITRAERTPNSPNVPTVGETVKGYEALGWFGFFAPKGTPAPVIAKLNAAVNSAIASPEIEEQARRQGLDRLPGTPADLARILKTDHARWGGIIRGLGLGSAK